MWYNIICCIKAIEGKIYGLKFIKARRRKPGYSRFGVKWQHSYQSKVNLR